MNTSAIIFVVDSSDDQRLKEAKEELCKILEQPELSNTLLLIFANKQDIDNAATPTEISNLFQLEKLKNKFHVQPSCATTGVGIEDGFSWVASNLTNQKKK